MISAEAGFVVLCDPSGLTRQVLVDHTGMLEALTPGQPLALIYDSQNVEKALQFLQAIRQNHVAFGWELDVRHADQIITLFFAGALYDDTLLVIGAPAQSRVVLSLYDEIMRISHEQNNQLRALLKATALEQRDSAGREAARETSLYEEFTQINNQLVNTQRELAKRNTQLQAEYERQRIISEMVSDYAFALWVEQDGTLHLEWITEAYARITGYSIEALRANPAGWPALLYPGAESAARLHLETCLAGHADQQMLHIITREGEQRHLRVSCQPIRDEQSGRVSRVYGAARDITESVRAEQQARALELERERSAILADFIQGALHEFHTPLTIIKTQLYLLNRTTADARQHKALHQLESQADAIQGLVNALATMARLDQSDTAAEPGVIEPGALASEVHQMHAGEAASKALSLSLTLGPDLPPIYASARDLHLALEAVLDNALRYTPPGGTIHLDVARQDADVAFTVRDTGIGIAADDLPHIFERFWRADKARTGRGFGLGLPIARKIVENHHGRIEVQSAPGAGSTFRLVLPVHFITPPPSQGI